MKVRQLIKLLKSLKDQNHEIILNPIMVDDKVIHDIRIDTTHSPIGSDEQPYELY